MKLADRSYYYGATKKRIFVREWGDKNHPTILLLHGFPGSSEHAQLMSGTPLWNTFRLVAVDRPGYGKSDPQYKMTPMQFALQMKNLFEDQNINEFYMISVSGATPYALAVLHTVPEKIKKVSCISGVSSLNLKTFRFLNKQQRKAWLMHSLLPNTVLKYLLGTLLTKNLNNLDKLLFTQTHTFSEADQKVFLHPEIGPELISTTQAALAAGPAGVLNDMRVYCKSWGFKLKDTSTPVTIWHGDSDDVVDHRFAWELQQKLPQAQVRLVEREGHYSLLMNKRDEILTDLLSQ